jgi:hypothetical protein
MSTMGFATIYFKVMDVVVLFFRLHQQEKDYILSMTTSMISWIEDIYGEKNVVNSCTTEYDVIYILKRLVPYMFTSVNFPN